ncbi:MAG: ABC transporter ATP-binding protein [Chloroflexi bacterium]|nr:ABC transporter ATP-binding protein [Chloroflexota bacterium]
MKKEVALSIEDLGKRFKIYPNPWDRMKEWMTFGRQDYHKDFWAVRNVSLNVHKGEFLGIIGPNGAGKSTLLKMITGVLTPTMGRYNTSGRVLSLLELGSGLDLELTGRENVLRSAQLLELPQGYVEERLEEIREFSELGEFFDRPISMYSTGMRTRLSFSMFAFIDCDILILDEVLAVGDIFFKQKCFARLDDLIKKETAIILVTHSMGIIQRYCDRVVLMNAGCIIHDGDPVVAIRAFTKLRGQSQARQVAQVVSQELLESGVPESDVEKYAAEFIENQKEPGFWPRALTLAKKQNQGGSASLAQFAVLDEKGDASLVFRQGETMHFYFEFELLETVELPVAQVEIRDERNLLLHSKLSLQDIASLPSILPKGYLVRFHHAIKLDLAAQSYIINLDLFTASSEVIDNLILDGSYVGLIRGMKRLCRAEGVLAIHLMPPIVEKPEQLFGGLASLPGKFEFQAVNERTRQIPSQ